MDSSEQAKRKSLNRKTQADGGSAEATARDSRCGLLVERVQRLVDKAQVVSFDVFDTLLVRPYLKPTDLFLHLEKVYSKPLFGICRVEAEAAARYLHPELQDVTLDMIYDEIDDEFKDMKQRELEWEEMTLRANPELKQVYDYALAKGKRIIISSDMYLPSVFIAAVLRKNGYDGWERIYMSGELNACKYSGALFRRALSELGVEPRHMLHIGDNRRADYSKPRRLGICAVQCCTPAALFLRSHRRYAALARGKVRTLGESIVAAVLAYDWQLRRCGLRAQRSYWETLGYQYGGPVGYGFSRFIEAQARACGAERLLFVARDGYLLQKIFALFGSGLPTAYVYAPRFLNHICRLDYVKRDKEQIRTIIDFFAARDPEIAAAARDFHGHPHDFICRHKRRIASLAAEQMRTYRAYVSGLVSRGEKLALVDSITGEFSSQKVLQSALSQELHGIYWGLCSDALVDRFKHSTFAGVQVEHSAAEHIFTKNWDFIEFLLTSPEHPIKYLDAQGLPMHDACQSPHELCRAKIYPAIETGALQFARDIHDRFGGRNVFLTASGLIRWVNDYVEQPSRRDMQHMRGLRCAINSAHTVWRHLFLSEIGLLSFLRSPKRAIRVLKDSCWRTFGQSVLLCLYKPIALHIRGLKRVSFSIFPYLRRRYFTLSLDASKQCFYRFVIGKIKD